MKTIEQLQEENAALMAQVEALQSAYQNLCGAINDMDDCEAGTDEMETAIDAVFYAMRNGYNSVHAAPQQHLLERDAQKGRAGFVAGFKLGIQTPKPAPDNCASAIDFVAYRIEKFANIKAHEYADSIRKGEVK